MKNGHHRFKPILSLLLVYLVLTVPSTAWAVENPQPELAPLNPAFVDYQADLDSDHITTNSVDPYSNGHVPTPLAPFEEDESLTLEAMSTFPSTYDLRSTDRLTPVRNQGDRRSCWTFASLASLESYLKNIETVDLSENNLMLNHGFDYSINQGGNRDMALAYLSRWDGPIHESADPYGSSKKTGLSPNYHIQSAEYLPKSASAIKEAIINGGAVATSMYSKAFDHSTYYNKANAALFYNGSAPIDHDVAIVGWDDNYSRHNFNNPPPNNGAWIIRNSWGSDWGDGGYFYLSYYDTYAGHKVTAFHNAETVNNYSQIYQYDPLGRTSASGYKSPFAWGANVFTSTASESLTAISTYALTPNTTMEIQIYTKLRSNQPMSGQLVSTQSEVFANPGYYTVNLNTPVDLEPDEKFAVAIKYHTPGYNFPIPVEAPIANYSSRASAKANESYIDDNGAGEWYDLGSNKNSNICIKAYTSERFKQESIPQEFDQVATPPDSKQPLADCYYKTHIENIGWQDARKNGELSGTSGQALRLEAIQIKADAPDHDLGLVYSTHIENIGWQAAQSDGGLSGTSGRALRLEAITIELTGKDAQLFDVYYRTHVQNVGWLNWASNGEKSGTAGYAYRLEGIQIKILPKDISISDLSDDTYANSNKHSYLERQ